jgi:hypothetical protein
MNSFINRLLELRAAPDCGTRSRLRAACGPGLPSVRLAIGARRLSIFSGVPGSLVGADPRNREPRRGAGHDHCHIAGRIAATTRVASPPATPAGPQWRQHHASTRLRRGFRAAPRSGLPATPRHPEPAARITRCPGDADARPAGRRSPVMSSRRQAAGKTARILRRTGFDRNPMRRSTDRIQAILRAILLAASVIGAPIVTAGISHQVYLAGLRTGQAQANAWHRVPALVQHVTLVATPWRHPAISGTEMLQVRWATPDGSYRTGDLLWGADTVAGSTVTVWIDASGRLAHPPLTHADAVDHLIGAAVATPAVLALLLWVAARMASLLLDRYQMASWEADWLAVEPRWSRRR